MKKLLLLIYTGLLVSGFHPAIGQESEDEAINKVYTVFIYNFTKYIQWPDEYVKGNFIIGVLGHSKLNTELQKLADSKTVNGRKILVKKYKTVAEIDKICHILYIPNESSNFLNAALQRTTGKPTLIITNKDGSGKFGSLINFVSDKGKPRFEMNVSAFEQHRLKFAQQLKTVAIVI